MFAVLPPVSVCMVSFYIHYRRPTYTCAYGLCALVRPSHRAHARVRIPGYASRRTTLRGAFADAKNSRRYSPDCGLKFGTRGDESGSARTGGAREQSETGGQGGAGARLLKSYRIHPGHRHAAQSGPETAQSTRYSRPVDVPFNVRRRTNVQVLKYGLANLHDAYDLDEHEHEIERIRDEALLDNCTGQEFADTVNKLIRDHNPYIQMPYAGERLGRLIIKFLPAALAGEGRALLCELIDKKLLGKESRVIEETVRLVKMAHVVVPVSAATKDLNKKDKRAVAAARTARKGNFGGAPLGGAPYELPNGQWCSKGTCHFTHDK
eukprot:6214640-Pleurochrysis_carterae.AAC.2